jgi:hypothetical protein
LNGGIDVPELIKELWESDFFQTERTISNIMAELQSKGFNLDFDVVYSALKSQDFILVRQKVLEGGEFPLPSYIQKYPVPSQASSSFDEIVYGKGDAYDFYKDLKSIIGGASIEVAISDSYAATEIVTLYLDNLPDNVQLRILTNEVTTRDKEKFYEICGKFIQNRNKKLEVRSHPDCHDRMIFVDSTAWVSGLSMKDAGRKPTYLVKIRKAKALRSIFDQLWSQSKKRLSSVDVVEAPT